MSERSPEFFELGSSVIYQALDDEVILLNLTNQQYYGLDEIGADMWRLLLEHRSIDSAVAHLHRIYDADEETLRRDVVSLSGELVAAGLLSRVPLSQ